MVGRIIKGQGFKILTAHINNINSLTFSPQSTIIASASNDNNIIIWDLEKEQIKVLKGHSKEVNNISFSPNAQILASASLDNKIKLWNWKNMSKILINKNKFENFQNGIYDISFHPQGKIMASADAGFNVKLWDLDKDQEIKLPHTIKGYSTTFTPDGKTIASTLNENIILWSVADGSKIHTFPGIDKLSVYNIDISQDGRVLASASADKTIKLWNIQEKKLIATLEGHNGEVRDVKFHHKGKLLASASTDNTVKIWNVEKRTEITTLKRHSAPILSVGFSPDGKYLASAGEDKKIIIWDLDLLDRNKLLKFACKLAKNYLRQEKKEDMHLCDNNIDF